MKVTVATPYYQDPNRLMRYLDNYNLWDCFEKCIIVDDGSQFGKATQIVEDYLDEVPEHRGRISVFTITEDLGFNAHGARNLAMKHVETDWALLIDIDQVLTDGFCDAFYRTLNEVNSDEYIVLNLFGGDPGNIFACRTEDYWKAGGYDEEFVGIHAGDRFFRNRLDSFLKPVMMKTKIGNNRAGRKVIESPSVYITTYPDDKTCLHPPKDRQGFGGIIKLVEERNRRPETWKDIPIINFRWRQDI